ncbi:MAG: MFS transporter [Solirubrobacterales bacterium]|nr:MFS transporter [Solirubrobacterales bacterium]
MKAETNRELAVAAPGASALLWSSILARLPLAMFSIALLVHAQRLTGSFAVAGLVSGAYAVASAAAAPLLGSVVDRCGQTMVLVCGALATALVLVVDGLLPVSTPAFVLIGLGAATGLFTPPLAACVRTLLPAIVDDPARLPALFALESTILEVTFVAGPPLALGLGSLWSPGGALVVSGSVMLVGTLAFAGQPASRRWHPARRRAGARGGSLRSPTIRILVMILLATGTAFGGTEVGVTAGAHALGASSTAGPLLGLWGVGSLLGGIAATRAGGGAGPDPPAGRASDRTRSADPRDPQHGRDRRRDHAGRRDDRAYRLEYLRDGRLRGARGHANRGILVAARRLADRCLVRQRGSRRARPDRWPCRRVRGGRRRRRRRGPGRGARLGQPARYGARASRGPGKNLRATDSQLTTIEKGVPCE